jgi:hypothetical protein
VPDVRSTEPVLLAVPGEAEEVGGTEMAESKQQQAERLRKDAETYRRAGLTDVAKRTERLADKAGRSGK